MKMKKMETKFVLAMTYIFLFWNCYFGIVEFWEPTNQWNQCMNRINQCIKESINESMNQWINESINGSIVAACDLLQSLCVSGKKQFFPRWKPSALFYWKLCWFVFVILNWLLYRTFLQLRISNSKIFERIKNPKSNYLWGELIGMIDFVHGLI